MACSEALSLCRHYIFWMSLWTVRCFVCTNYLWWRLLMIRLSRGIASLNWLIVLDLPTLPFATSNSVICYLGVGLRNTLKSVRYDIVKWTASTQVSERILEAGIAGGGHCPPLSLFRWGDFGHFYPIFERKFHSFNTKLVYFIQGGRSRGLRPPSSF